MMYRYRPSGLFLAIALLGTASLHAQTVLSLTENATGSSAPAFGSTLVGMVNDTFAYDPFSPISPAPDRAVDSNLPECFHGNEPEGTDVTLNYTLSGGTHTTTALEPTIVIDVWGRGDRSEASAEGQRDNDFDILLLNGAAVVATVPGLAIDNDAAGDHARATFDGLAVGTQFDGVRIIGHDSGSEAANYFTMLEIRAASIGDPPPFTVQAWYRMGDDGVGTDNLPQDSSGNAYHYVTAQSGATVVTSASGGGYNDDAYYTFNGTDEAFVDNSYNAPEDNFGIEVWVRTSNLSQDDTHVFGTGTNHNGLNIGFHATGDIGWFGAVAGKVFVGSQGLGNYTSGEWIHLAVVRESGTSTFYVNGVPSGTSGSTPNDATSSRMGVTADDGTYFDGALAEARIFTFGPGEFSVSDLLYPSLSTGSSPYDNWTSGFPSLSDDDPTVDADFGGLATGIEWVTGGDPSDGSDDAGKAPTFDNTSDPDDFLFTFRRRDDAEADSKTTIVVEYGSDLTGWTPAAHGVDGVSIDDSTDLGGGFHSVTVSIPRALEVDRKLFARLTVTVVTP